MIEHNKIAEKNKIELSKILNSIRYRTKVERGSISSVRQNKNTKDLIYHPNRSMYS